VLGVYNKISYSGPIFFVMSNSVQTYMKSTLAPFSSKNRMILEYKVTLFVHKLLSESYVFSVVFVIKFS